MLASDLRRCCRICVGLRSASIIQFETGWETSRRRSRHEHLSEHTVDEIAEHGNDRSAVVTQDHRRIPVHLLAQARIEFAPCAENQAVEVLPEEARVIPFGGRQVTASQMAAASAASFFWRRI